MQGEIKNEYVSDSWKQKKKRQDKQFIFKVLKKHQEISAGSDSESKRCLIMEAWPQ